MPADDTLPQSDFTSSSSSVSSRMPWRPIAGLTGLGLLTLMLAGCNVTDSGAPISPPPPPPVLYANIVGLVSDASNGNTISGASVTAGAPVSTAASGFITTTSGTDGTFTLNKVTPTSRMVMHVTQPGYVDGYPVTNTVLGQNQAVSALLLPFGATTSMADATNTATVSIGTTASATIPANSLDLPASTAASGSAAPTAATGPATLAIAAYTPGQGVDDMPGDFVTSTGLQSETFGSISVSVTNASNQELVLASGQTVSITVPMSSRDTTVPSSADLFYFDPSTGKWTQDGTATLNGSSTAFTGTIDKLGIWMVGLPISPAVQLTGCVVNADGNTPAPGVRVTAQASTYSGLTTAITDANGNFSAAVKPNSTLIVNGQFGERTTNTEAGTTTSTGSSLAACLVLPSESGTPHVTLSWGQLPHDLDSHLFMPNGSQVYYANRGSLSSSPYANLDVDNTSGFGPEVITISRLMVGTYTYGVRNFSDTFSPGITASPAKVEFQYGTHIQVYNPTASMGEVDGDDWWTVFSFHVDSSCNISTITPIEIFSSGPDTGPAAPALPSATGEVYCTPSS